jgi:hypothetical protein
MCVATEPTAIDIFAYVHACVRMCICVHSAFLSWSCHSRCDVVSQAYRYQSESFSFINVRSNYFTAYVVSLFLFIADDCRQCLIF